MTAPASPTITKKAYFLNSSPLILNRFRLHIAAVHLQRLYVEVDIRARAEVLAQLTLYVSGAAVSLVKGQSAGHTQVHFYRYAVAYAARAQVVHAAHAVFSLGNILYFTLYLLGKAFLQKLVRRLLHQRKGCLYDENAHHDGGDWVEHGPAFAKKDGTADAERRAD